jgi:hypothetical protein
MSNLKSRATIQLPGDFFFGELRPDHTKPAPPATAPPLGPLAAFNGDFAGNGFNTIFRPDSVASPTPLPIDPPPAPPHDNILELNLTSETLSFSKSLGSVPNRGTGNQPDVFLNGIPYVQQINDTTIHGESTPIHFEPGLWMHVPQTVIPNIAATVFRMGSIPHGTTIEAQGLVTTATPGPPNIQPVDITPTIIATGTKFAFPSQTAANNNTLRIPQDLTPFSTRITQAMLTNPNSVLKGHISKQKILSTTTIIISTNPSGPLFDGLFGGGTDNIAFLLGDSNTPPKAPNADAVQMDAIFWIETVEETLRIPFYTVGSPPVFLKAKASVPGQRVAQFSVTPKSDIAFPGRDITVTFTQIQYSQNVTLVFNGLAWPHVSVNTLVPADPIEISAP